MYLDKVYVLYKKIYTGPTAPREKSPKYRFSEAYISLNLSSFWVISLLLSHMGMAKRYGISFCHIDTPVTDQRQEQSRWNFHHT